MPYKHDESSDKEAPTTSDNSGGGCGCISTVLLIIAVWALIFGVTVNGKHYGIRTCSCENGVVIDR